MAIKDRKSTNEPKLPLKGKRAARKSTDSRGQETKGQLLRTRVLRSFPASTFEEALIIAEGMQKFAPGQPKVRRLTLFDKLGKSADSGPSRQWVTNSSKYGLTTGSYKAEFIELTADGNLATAEDAAPAIRLDARFRLSIRGV